MDRYYFVNLRQSLIKTDLTQYCEKNTGFIQHKVHEYSTVQSTVQPQCQLL